MIAKIAKNIDRRQIAAWMPRVVSFIATAAVLMPLQYRTELGSALLMVLPRAF